MALSRAEPDQQDQCVEEILLSNVGHRQLMRKLEFLKKEKSLLLRQPSIVKKRIRSSMISFQNIIQAFWFIARLKKLPETHLPPEDLTEQDVEASLLGRGSFVFTPESTLSESVVLRV
jgi:hypothetical protein